MRYLKLLLIPLVIVACTEPLTSPQEAVEEEPEAVVKPPRITGCPTGLDVPMCPGSGDPIPPVVTIYDLNMVEIDALTVDAGELFTLIGVAVGNTPFSYFWLQTADGNTISIGDTSYLIDYLIDQAGDYVIVFEVIDANGLTGSDQVEVTVLPVEPEVIEVTIDIKPGSDPNTVNLGSNGNVPVAIFSTVDFDAATIDPATVKLADAEVRVVGKKGSLQAALEDVNGDGLLDLIVHIDTQGLELAPGDVVAVVTGMTFDGDAIEGSDAVQIVPEANLIP